MRPLRGCVQQDESWRDGRKFRPSRLFEGAHACVRPEARPGGAGQEPHAPPLCQLISCGRGQPWQRQDGLRPAGHPLQRPQEKGIPNGDEDRGARGRKPLDEEALQCFRFRRERQGKDRGLPGAVAQFGLDTDAGAKAGEAEEDTPGRPACALRDLDEEDPVDRRHESRRIRCRWPLCGRHLGQLLRQGRGMRVYRQGVAVEGRNQGERAGREKRLLLPERGQRHARFERAARERRNSGHYPEDRPSAWRGDRPERLEGFPGAGEQVCGHGHSRETQAELALRNENQAGHRTHTLGQDGWILTAARKGP